MNNRHSSKYDHKRSSIEEKYRILENTLMQKCYANDSLKDIIIDTNQQNDLSYSSPISIEQLFNSNDSKCLNTNLFGNALTKDREIAKLRALVYQKDNELIALASTHKNALLQVEDRMERERKVWHEHKELLLADERAKFEEEKIRLVKDLQDKLNIERKCCQNLEKKLYDAQMQSSETKFLLKESDRERINAIYSMKEQCRKEYQNEIIRSRNQFQLEKDIEFARLQEHARELEETINYLSTANANVTAQQHRLLVQLTTAEKTCIHTINDIIKKLLMAMDTPSHTYSTIPNISSFVYDETAIFERTPTRNILKFLQNTVDDIRNYIIEQRVQIETKTILLQKTKQSSERTLDLSNRSHDDNNKLYLKSKKKNDSLNSCQLSVQQNHTVDNLIQKLEDHIAFELTRLSEQRTASNHHAELPPEKIKFEKKIDNEINQDALIRHLQNRMNELRNDNMRLRDNKQSKSIFSLYNENNNQRSFTSMRSLNSPITL
ncbi:unnamed protein product [Adineta steineri]|uniref:Uncharacterized protein n=1 Tax=Adineta steineri TaxID=433720 RepID=A0A815YMA7_9BILA|nr:unnamed protein product [Adineta steineri]CAF1572912.1 unnamed protein product [Adineta steineri]